MSSFDLTGISDHLPSTILGIIALGITAAAGLGYLSTEHAVVLTTFVAGITGLLYKGSSDGK